MNDIGGMDRSQRVQIGLNLQGANMDENKCTIYNEGRIV